MVWGNNLINNPSAETQDLSYWTVTPVSKVTVEENETIGLKYLPITDDRETWNEDTYKEFMIYGLSGTYSFVFTPYFDIEMHQIIYASDMGEDPENFQFNLKFKYDIAQNYWDTTVLALGICTIVYTDGTKDYFHIPCVRGTNTSDRFLVDWWTMVYATCAVNTDKVINYVKVAIKTISCNKILYVDLVELRKESA